MQNETVGVYLNIGITDVARSGCKPAGLINIQYQFYQYIII